MRQRLGQHFLINKSAIGKIIAALDIQRGDTIVEIGPGKGALTLPLARECRIIGVEKDKILARELAEALPEAKIVEGDVLKILPQLVIDLKLEIGNWKLAGNIPYYITGKLLRIIGELENKPKLTVLTIQKEVAERIVAKPPRMNLLAAAVQIWADPEIIINLKPDDFSPPPKVSSAIIKLIPNLRRSQRLRLGDYYRLIKAVFKQPRKTVLNNLSTGSFDPAGRPKEELLKILQKVGLKGDERPQNLSLEHLIKLSTFL
jgi:16S rRNA (adenine1518-N6/adenine1519-N6)-dimethyltransferase